MNKKISLISVNYNSSKKLNNLISSLDKINKIIGEIIIIDNNSSDLKILTKEKIKLIKNETNLGFAKAVNQGIIQANNEYILLLNPDTEVIDSSINKLFDQIYNNTKIGAIGGRIQHMDDNNFQYTATNSINFFIGLFEFTVLKKLFPHNVFSNFFWIESKKNIIKPIRVQSLCGAFILFKKYIDNKYNLFDESFFLYLEDVDFGLNINQKGHYVIFDPAATIKHVGGASNNSRYNIVLKHWYESRKVLFKKHSNFISSGILNLVFNIESQFLKIYHKIKNEPEE